MWASLLISAALSFAVHEAGHYTAGRTLGYRCGFGLGWLGPYTIIGTDLQPGDITGWRARTIAAAGPAASAALYLVAVRYGLVWLALMQLDMLLLASLRDYKRIITGGGRYVQDREEPHAPVAAQPR